MIAVWLLACTKDEPGDTGPVLDTGWFTDTAAFACTDRVTSTSPAPATLDWYARDPLVVHTGTRDEAAYAAEIVDDDRVPVPSRVEWVADRPEFRVIPDAPLEPQATYSLVVTDCAGMRFVPFVTSSFGLPLDGGPSSLIDAAFDVRLQDAVWEQPAGLGGLIALYLDWPVLTGVQYANDDLIDLIGAQGYIGTDGLARQLTTEPTWDYPLAPFDRAPYVEATADRVDIAVSDSVAMPVYEFRLEGTFSSDAQSLGGARVSGLGDTRGLGVALDLGDEPDAVCRAAGSFGVSCVPCPDDELLCIPIVATRLVGTRVPGVVVERVE